MKRFLIAFLLLTASKPLLTSAKAQSQSGFVFGVDVSAVGPGRVSWAKVPPSPISYAGNNYPLSFAYVRASKGAKNADPHSQFKDPDFDWNINAGNITVGAYHVAAVKDINTLEQFSAIDEANFFFAVAGNAMKPGKLRPALDLETGSTTDPSKIGYPALGIWVDQWMKQVHELTGGVWPVIYCSGDYKTQIGKVVLQPSGKTIAQTYDLWVADWTTGGDPGVAPSTSPWPSALVDQYATYNPNFTGPAFRGFVPGIGRVDLDVNTANFQSTLVIGGTTIGFPTITVTSPLNVSLAAGGTFTVDSTINTTARTMILGCSLYPTGQNSGRIDDPSHDMKVSLSAGLSSLQRQFTIPPNTAPGSYDVVVALWDDLNNNGQIDSGDQQVTTPFKVAGAVTVLASGSACSYSLDPSRVDLTAPGAATSRFNVSTGSSCGWNAVSNQAWITIIDNAPGTGFGQPTFSVAANTSSSSRTGTISVQGQTFTVTQPGASLPSDGYQNVTVSGVLVAPPSSRPGLAPTLYADVNSPISQNVLLGATIVLTGTNTVYYDPSHDTPTTLFAGQTQYHRSFTIPTNVPVGTYDVIFGVWADTNGNGVIDNTTDVYLGSFTGYGALTVQPALGGIFTTLAPQGAIDAGAQWRCDGGNWLGGGAQQFQTSVGYHTIRFQPVPGWITPADQVVSVQTAQTMQVTGTYTSAANTTVPVTVQPDHIGASFTVDDATYIGPANFDWIPGSTHTVSTNSSQSQVTAKGSAGDRRVASSAGSADTQYSFTGWSDYLPIIHNVAPSTGTTLTAHFVAQYLLTAGVSAGGFVSSNGGWYFEGETVNITATPATGYVFAGWSGSGNGSYSGQSASTSVTMGGPITETAKFVLATSATTLGNISTRLPVGTGDNGLIAGFIVTGSQPKKVIVRGMGPSLPVVGALADPVLELHDASGVLLETNDNWVDNPNKQAIIDSTIPPTNNLESAIVRTLPANGAAYTAILRGASNTTGIGVVEVYDLDSAADSKLANISSRGLVQTGDDVLIAGMIMVGQASRNVIIRAIGPSLNVPGRMVDPTLELHDGNGEALESNDNWVDSPNKQAIIDSTIPPTNNLESAIVHTVVPGNYTAIVRGVNKGIGIAVVEAYDLGPAIVAASPTPTAPASPTPTATASPTATATPNALPTATPTATATATPGPNLIVNSSFESPGFTTGNQDPGRQRYVAPSTEITGWTIGGTGDIWLHKCPDIQVAGPSYCSADDGAIYVDLSGSGPPHATIYQDFPTTPGQSYQLSFFIGASNLNSPSSTINVQVTGASSLLNTNVTPLAPAPAINWSEQKFLFIANSTSTSVSFTGTSTTDDNVSFIDNVTVR